MVLSFLHLSLKIYYCITYYFEIIFSFCIQSGEKQTVTQYQITDWDANGHMNNIQTILTVLNDVYKVQHKMGNTPIVVHCK